MIIEKDLSSRFRLVSSLSLIGVVIIHSKFIMSRWDKWVDASSLMGTVSWNIQYIISENIARIAVPLFFFISGYFIAIDYDSSLNGIKKKLTKRFKTLLVPYLLFCIIWFVPYWLMDHSLSLINAIIYPVPYQFWFLQHLMILSLGFWVIYYLRKWKWITLTILCCMYIFSKNRWGGFEESLLFYSLGIFLSSVRASKYKWLVFPGLILTTLFVAICYFDRGNMILHHMMVLCGSLTVIFWIFSSTQTYKTLLPAGVAFFVYACHEPILSSLKTLTLNLNIDRSETLVLYLVLPIVTICICILSYTILNRFFPKAINLLIGR